MRSNLGPSYFFFRRFFPLVSLGWRDASKTGVFPISRQKRVIHRQQKLLEITTLTLNLRPKAFPSAGEECLRLGVPPRGQSARIPMTRKKSAVIRHLLAGSKDGLCPEARCLQGSRGEFRLLGVKKEVVEEPRCPTSRGR